MTTYQTKDENFENDVLKSSMLTLVDFWAEWCGPCKQISPLLEEIANEKKDIVKVIKLNVDENRETTEKYNIMGIPTLLLFKDGELAETQVGLSNKAMLLKLINKHIS